MVLTNPEAATVTGKSATKKKNALKKLSSVVKRKLSSAERNADTFLKGDKRYVLLRDK